MRVRVCCALSLLLGAGVWAGCRRAQSYQPPPTPVRVESVKVHAPGKQAVSARYSAIIKPAAQVELAFKSDGYVSAIHQARGADGRTRDVQEGDWIARGTALARLRAADFENKASRAEAQLAEARSAHQTSQAQLAEAEAALRQARTDLERARDLLESRSLTRPEYEAAKTKFDLAEARADAARAQTGVAGARINAARALAAEARLAVADAVLPAPISGLLLKRTVEVGALASPGLPTFVIADLSSVKAVFGVPDVVAAQLKPGLTETLTSEAIPGVEMRGLITRIAPAADPKSRVFEVEVTIPRPPSQLRIGMIAALLLDSGGVAAAAPAPVVPLSAIVRPRDDPAAYAVYLVVEQNGRQIARLRRVKLGAAIGNAVVVEGVNAGERVVVSGAAMLTDGERVQVAYS